LVLPGCVSDWLWWLRANHLLILLSWLSAKLEFLSLIWISFPLNLASYWRVL
jgi:hypothetical protein